MIDIEKINLEKIRVGVATRCVENCTPISQEKCDEYVRLYGEVNPCKYCGADQVLQFLADNNFGVGEEVEMPEPYECGDEYCQPYCHEQEREQILNKVGKLVKFKSLKDLMK